MRTSCGRGTGRGSAIWGTEDIELDLSGATVRAVRWEDGVAAGQWQAGVDGPRSLTAGPGWEYELPFGHDHRPGWVVTAHVDNLLAFDGEFWRACSAWNAGAARDGRGKAAGRRAAECWARDPSGRAVDGHLV